MTSKVQATNEETEKLDFIILKKNASKDTIPLKMTWDIYIHIYIYVYIYTRTHSGIVLNHKKNEIGLPWWCSGWESACQCRGHRFKRWSGKIPHAAEQLGLWATTTEPERLEPVLCNKRGHDSERPAHRDEEWPPLAATRESPHTETKTQHSQK